MKIGLRLENGNCLVEMTPEEIAGLAPRMGQHLKNTEQLALRLPGGLRHRIKIAAAMNRRSMNAEVIMQLVRLYPATGDNS